MKLPTLLATTTLTLLATASSGEPSCGKCDTLPSAQLGGNAQIPLRTSAKTSGEAYKCTTFGKEVRLSTCINRVCGLCMIFA